MNIYDLKINAMKKPMIVDNRNPAFSWKMSSNMPGTMQTSYNIILATDSLFNDVIWNSGNVLSDISQNIKCPIKLKSETDYYVKVKVNDNYNNTAELDGIFSTGLMCSDKLAWSDAQWIGSPQKTINTDGSDTYKISYDVFLTPGNKSEVAIAARNKKNYILISIDVDNKTMCLYSFYDNAWTNGKEETRKIYSAFLPNKRYINHTEIIVNKTYITVKLNGNTIIDNIEIFDDISHYEPRKQAMLNIGIKQIDSRAVYDNFKIENQIDKIVYQYDEFKDDSTVLSALGHVEEGRLVVENEFNLITPVPTVNVRKIFEIKKDVKRACLYSSAYGFYDAYINGKKINEDFFNPGFTDYRAKIFYQMYEISEFLKKGKNVIGATVAKGYYSGYIGYYPNTMLYGEMNAFICQLKIEYEDGTKEVIITDDSWQFTDKGSVMNADYLQGEIYDARLEFDWNNLQDRRWKKCGIIPWKDKIFPTNGDILEDAKFKLVAQEGPTAKVERILKIKSKPLEKPKGHFIYDFGQNMVGTIRIRAKAKRGVSINIRYGEMCYREGRIYLANLRSAANTDIYTFKGDANGEVFVPSFVSHGFRYVEISGNGIDLNERNIEIIELEGLVLTNTNCITGGFKCSDQDINKLQSNIQWGQRGNSLLVFTDCPQRNERMGWTGDAQVFAATAAYNMDVQSFMNKWLSDLREAQLMYNINGAVPDTAPLGGDNRPMGGCSGWGDAAVIVPWEMYKAYGDVEILEKNYDMMRKWVNYLNLPERRNFGMRIIDGKTMEFESDISTIPYIQCQQSRGDHLAVDETTPFILTATAYAARSYELFIRIAKILGKKHDAIKYYEIYENIKRAFREAWVKPDGSLAYWGEQSKYKKDVNGNVINRTYYSNSPGSKSKPSQTAYVLAIRFNLIPEDKIKHAVQCLKEAIDERDGKLSVGFLGISHLLPALSSVQLDNYAFAILEQTDNPGWLYSVKNGATTIWERWNSYIAETDTFGDTSMNSFNHYAYGAVGEWLMNHILGINTSCKINETGYKHIILTPNTGGSLKYAKGYHESPYGVIKSAWKKHINKIEYECEIPPNTSATLYLNKEVIELGSGKYKFIYKESKAKQ